MSIHNAEKFVSTLWDWKILNGCFGNTRIAPTDIDGLVERNGFFLLLETKSPGVDIPVGQGITFENLVRTGYFTVAVVWGQKDAPEEILLMTRMQENSETGWGVKKTHYEHADLTTLRTLTSRWFGWAEENGAALSGTSMMTVTTTKTTYQTVMK